MRAGKSRQRATVSVIGKKKSKGRHGAAPQATLAAYSQLWTGGSRHLVMGTSAQRPRSPRPQSNTPTQLGVACFRGSRGRTAHNLVGTDPPYKVSWGPYPTRITYPADSFRVQQHLHDRQASESSSARNASGGESPPSPGTHQRTHMRRIYSLLPADVDPPPSDEYQLV